MTFLRECAATGLFFHPLCRATMHLVTIGAFPRPWTYVNVNVI